MPEHIDADEAGSEPRGPRRFRWVFSWLLGILLFVVLYDPNAPRDLATTLFIACYAFAVPLILALLWAVPRIILRGIVSDFQPGQQPKLLSSEIKPPPVNGKPSREQ